MKATQLRSTACWAIILFVSLVAIELSAQATQRPGRVRRAARRGEISFQPLFAGDGPVKQGWTIREWDDVSKPPHKPVIWEVIRDTNLDDEHAIVKRHVGDAPVLPISKRPRRGHIGFQDLSGAGGKLRVRNAQIAVLD